jgi:hypothetical protein
MANSATAPSTRVRTLNDLLRRHRIGGQVVLTPGVRRGRLDVALLPPVDVALLPRVAA